MKTHDKLLWSALVVLLLLRFGGGASIIAPSQVSAAVYVHEKSDTAVPSAVLAGLNTINRQGIVATLFDVDTRDGSGETPEQYKVAVSAAKEAGLPSLIVMGGDKVVRIVKSPTTEQQLLEAAGIK